MTDLGRGRVSGGDGGAHPDAPPAALADGPSPATTLADLAGALAAVDRVLAEGDAIHGDRWRRQSVYAHVAHAVAHLQVWMAERSHEDLEHAFVRCAMALELAIRDAERADHRDHDGPGDAGDGEALPDA